MFDCPIPEIAVANCYLRLLRKHRGIFFETILEVVAVEAKKRICKN